MTNTVSIGAFLMPMILLLLPFTLFAHETHIYDINGVEYEIVIGSLGEPVIVDDKTGVSLEIVRDGEFFLGAQDALQIEMIAGDTSRIDPLSPVHGSEGMYKTTFIATVPTTLKYRVFGELEGVPFDQTYVCNPVGHPASEENTERITISEGVTETLSRGNFGCPQPKGDFGFPEPAASSLSLANGVADLNGQMNAQNETVPPAAERELDVVALLALFAGILGIILGIAAYIRKNKIDHLV